VKSSTFGPTRARAVFVPLLAAVTAVAVVAMATACESDGNSGGTNLSLDSGTSLAPTLDASSSYDATTSAPSDSGSEPDATKPVVTGGVAIDVPSLGSGFDYHQGSYSLGWAFVANAPSRVTALGFYDDKKDGLTASHPVGIYEKTSKVLLTSATVSPSDPLDGYFRYVTLPTPLDLTPGTEYVVMALVGDETYLAFNSFAPGWTVNAAIGYRGGAVYYADSEATTLVFPDTLDPASSGGDFGPNFKFAAP
jgi:hypothetical protein